MNINIDVLKQRAQAAVSKYPHDYQRGMLNYLDDNRNVQLLADFIMLAFEAKKTHHCYGSKAIFEKLRWDSERKESAANYKLCNEYTPDLARLAMHLEPKLNGFFKTRPRKRAAA